MFSPSMAAISVSVCPFAHSSNTSPLSWRQGALVLGEVVGLHLKDLAAGNEHGNGVRLRLGVEFHHDPRARRRAERGVRHAQALADLLVRVSLRHHLKDSSLKVRQFPAVQHVLILTEHISGSAYLTPPMSMM